MNAVRRGLIVSVVAALVSGCASAPPPAVPKTYDETISSLMISEDGKHIAAIGASHHYIFGAPELVVRAVRSPIHPRLTATFSTFHVDVTGKVTGDYTIALSAGASADDQRAAADIGLIHADDGHWGASGTLAGQRYTGWAYKFGREQAALNQTYTIQFTNDASTADRIVDDAATPIRIAADGVQLIYYAPLAPIIIPIIFATRAKDH